MEDTELNNVPEPKALRFESVQDMLNHVGHAVEDANNWLAANDRDVVKSYREGNTKIVATLSAFSKPCEYDLVISAIPGWIYRNLCPGLGGAQREEHPYGGDHFMLLSDAYVVECPEEVIPSFVWLVRSEYVLDFVREILATPEPVLFKFLRTSAEWECGASSSSFAERYGYGVASDIKRIPKVMDGVSEGSRQGGNRPPNLRLDIYRDLVNVVLRIFLMKHTIRHEHQGVVEPLKVEKVFLCVRNFKS